MLEEGKISTARLNRRRRASENLLLSLAEHLKLPLLQISQSAELARLTDQPAEQLEAIELTADNALRLLDYYLLSTNLAKQQLAAQLEPVSLSAVLNNVANELYKFAAQYQCKLELSLSGKYEPIMAHRGGLEAALTSLGYVFIEAQGSTNDKQKPLVKLAAHRGKKGLVAGMFAENENLSADMYRRAHGLYGQARQPLTGLTAANGAGVFIAESILDAMSAKLRVARHHNLSGLAATFMPSSQLSMV
ncbi:MAG TPA: hypothetical protein VJJ78_02275 [Candidatus Saccharimonadales bacterium]|nr:hypothetical protein [Candidatus Saccharimonadales bacterium]